MFIKIATSLTIICSVMLYCCTSDGNPNKSLFVTIDNKDAGIDFVNALTYTDEMNVYTFRNFYNGSGVGLGDFDNDGYVDIFFCGNQVDNKLYLNKGSFAFDDVTEASGVASNNIWTTGVSIVDINADGWLDIYTCKSGDIKGENRHNELFINQGIDNDGDIHFVEKSKEYGLDDIGLATHAAFFDYDLDGDLDCYLLNNSFRSVGNYDLRKDQRLIRDSLGGNKLLMNVSPHNNSNLDHSVFEDVSEVAGIYGSSIGFGLGVAISDLNSDGWPDIYVSNDFFEKDYLYVNQKDGTFLEEVDSRINELSMGSMGADIADINNDGHPEIFVTEMLPQDEVRAKSKAQFENWNKYKSNIENGYHRQFARNVLQLNDGKGDFQEIGRYAGIEATDWSWGALIFDMDNDGYKDLFVANGIYKDLLDQDYINFYSNPAAVREILHDKNGGITKLIDKIPSEALTNFAFRNNGNLSFSNETIAFGFSQKTFSNGSAYGDMDNDGDLDLVVNNINMPPLIYQNQSDPKRSNYLQIDLHDNSSLNVNAIGAKIQVHTSNGIQTNEVYAARGFMSSVSTIVNFGFKEGVTVDSIAVRWPDLTRTILKNPNLNQLIKIEKQDKLTVGRTSKTKKVLMYDNSSFRPIYSHAESSHSDFDREPLKLQMHSNLGPCTCIGDVNNDGLSDFYVGGAAGQSGTLFVQNIAGGYSESIISSSDSESEETTCTFFDANGDEKDDLYVGHGSSEFGPNNIRMADALYINSGNGLYKSNQILPTFNFENTSAVASTDYDGDGDQDLIVSTFIRPNAYGIPSNTYILNNDGKGQMTNVTKVAGQQLTNVGMTSDLAVADVDNDGDEDLILVGEWMDILVFYNENGVFTVRPTPESNDLQGLWSSVFAEDLDQDGNIDLIVGNHGRNTRLDASPTEPLKLFINDFDRNGKTDLIHAYSIGDELYPFVQRMDLLKQIPVLNKKYPNFTSFAGQTMSDIFGEEQLNSGIELTVEELSSVILWNNGSGKFSKQILPPAAQLSTVFAITTTDVNGDGTTDIILGGNQHNIKPEIGINAASKGLVLVGKGSRKFEALSSVESGLSIDGQIRELSILTNKKSNQLLVSINNDHPKIYEIND